MPVESHLFRHFQRSRRVKTQTSGEYAMTELMGLQALLSQSGMSPKPLDRAQGASKNTRPIYLQLLAKVARHHKPLNPTRERISRFW